MLIDAKGLDFTSLNQKLRACSGDCLVTGCMGQRFIAAGMADRKITLNGVPGNALGAYLNGAEITVNGNAQDAVGDTMNTGKIVIHGNIGDAAGYAMRGGAIYVKCNAGYRAGIHMKEYRDKRPVMVIGGRAGSFLGEYQAGGIIIVLGLHTDGRPVVGNYPCTGMHGGVMFIRGNASGIRFPSQVTASPASEEDVSGIVPYLEEYCRLFGGNIKELLSGGFTAIKPDSRNPYKQMYVAN